MKVYAVCISLGKIPLNLLYESQFVCPQVFPNIIGNYTFCLLLFSNGVKQARKVKRAPAEIKVDNATLKFIMRDTQNVSTLNRFMVF